MATTTSDWVRVDKYHQANGAYRVSKCYTADAWRYVAAYGARRLGVFDTADQARAACEAHAQEAA